MAPKMTATQKVEEKPIPEISTIYAVVDGEKTIMSKNDPTKPAGLLGQCHDDWIPDEDEIIGIVSKFF